MTHYEIYVDGSHFPPTQRGGWAAIVRKFPEEGADVIRSGSVVDTTNNRMEILAAIKGISTTPEGADIRVFSDSQYLIMTMNIQWKRNKNWDLWKQLDDLVSLRQVKWSWIKGHAGNPLNEYADKLAKQKAQELI